MRITVITQSGSTNLADETVLVDDGKTVGDVVRMALGAGAAADRWLARVNGTEASFDQRLSDGQRVTIVSKKTAGA